MSTEAPFKSATPNHEGGIFFKCPTGGFASLRPGVCPKCREPLAPVISAKQVNEDGRLNQLIPVASPMSDREVSRG
ncbi:MAG: hypothetical protein H0T92_02095 [Pyrinomonadaceae bacterium]|nr:hypothetical protein [Pyrinomonadaceae bacterium]